MSKFAAMMLPVDVPARMIIQHPTKNVPLRDADGNEAWIDMLSADSEKARALERKLVTQRLARRNRTTLTAEELEAEQADKLAVLVTGWHLVGLDGQRQEVDCNEGNARDMLATPGMNWLREQVAEFQMSRANFSKASS